MAVYVPKGKSPEIILNSKSDLHKLNKILSDNQEELINVILSIAKDESEDKKLRLDASRFLLDKRVAVSESITKDQITKLLLADKLSGGSKQQASLVNEQPRAVLSLDIQRQEGVQYDELDKTDNTFDLSTTASFERQ